MEPEGPGRERRLDRTSSRRSRARFPPVPVAGCTTLVRWMIAALHMRAESCASTRASQVADRHLCAGGAERPGWGWPPPAPALQPQLVADAAHQVLRVDAELLQLVAVLLGIDLVRQLLLGLLDLVVRAALTQQLKDLVLRDLHGGSLGWGGWCCGRRAYSGSGRSSPGHVPVSLATPWREPWSASPRTRRKMAPSTTRAASSFTKPPVSRCCGWGGSSSSMRPHTCSKILRPTMPATRPRTMLNGVKTSFMGQSSFILLVSRGSR